VRLKLFCGGVQERTEECVEVGEVARAPNMEGMRSIPLYQVGHDHIVSVQFGAIMEHDPLTEGEGPFGQGFVGTVGFCKRGITAVPPTS